MSSIFYRPNCFKSSQVSCCFFIQIQFCLLNKEDATGKIAQRRYSIYIFINYSLYLILIKLYYCKVSQKVIQYFLCERKINTHYSYIILIYFCKLLITILLILIQKLNLDFLCKLVCHCLVIGI